MKKTAVILFNLGGPDTPEAVRPFLFNLFNDKAIIGLPQPFRWLVAKLISTRRAPLAQEIYAKIGGKSPLLELTEAQARALEKKLSVVSGQWSVRKEKKEQEASQQASPSVRGALRPIAKASRPEQGQIIYKVFICMRYWHPRAEETVSLAKAWGADAAVLLPLYPQFSTTTTASSFAEWAKEARLQGLDIPTARICCYPMQPDFIAAHAALLKAAYEKAAAHGRPRILFSAHGLPQKVVDAGDPYQWQVEQTAAAIIVELEREMKRGQEAAPALSPAHREGQQAEVGADYKICYQSKVGPLEWLKPSTEAEIARACADGAPIVLVPVAFVSEHSETLVELDIEYRELAEKQGCVAYERVPALGVQEEYIAALAALVRQAEWGETTPDTGRRQCLPQFARCGCRSAQ